MLNDFLYSKLRNENIEVIDHRESGGCLWALDGSKTRKLLKDNNLLRLFKFSDSGGKSTKHRSAWWTKEVVDSPDGHVDCQNGHAKDRVVFSDNEDKRIGEPPEQTSPNACDNSSLNRSDTDRLMAFVNTFPLTELAGPNVPSSVLYKLALRGYWTIGLVNNAMQQPEIRFNSDFTHYFDSIVRGVKNIESHPGLLSVSSGLSTDANPLYLESLLSMEKTIWQAPLSVLRKYGVSDRKVTRLADSGFTSIGDFIGVSAEDVCSSVKSMGAASTSKLYRAIFDLAMANGIFPPRQGGELRRYTNRSADKANPQPFITNFDDLYFYQTTLPLSEVPGLSEQKVKVLSENGFKTISDLQDVSAEQLMSLKSFGETSLKKFAKGLSDIGVSTGMQAANLSDPNDVSEELRRYVGSKYVPIPQSPKSLNLISPKDADERLYALSCKLEEQSDSYSQLLIQCIVDSNPEIEPDHLKMVIERFGIGERPKKLREIASESNITRERVRQIVKREEGKLDFSKSIRYYAYRCRAVELICRLGGMGPSVAFSEAFASEKDKPDNPFAILKYCEGVTVDEVSDTFLISETHYSRCEQCTSLRSWADNIKQDCSVSKYDDAVGSIGCNSCDNLVHPSIMLLAKICNLGSAENLIGDIENPVLYAESHPNSDTAIVRKILYLSGKAVSTAEMEQLFEEDTGRSTSRNFINSYMGRYEGALLWGRGTYIDSRFAPFPVELIERVSDFAISAFRDRNIPILGVGGLFDRFASQLYLENVPNQQALYSLLRKFDSPHLILKEYPWVCSAAEIGERTSFAKYFYSVLAANNGFISDKHAEMLAERCMAQSFALSGLAEYSPYLINANGGWYDIDAAGFDFEGIRELAIEVAEAMKENDIVSTKKVFSEHKARCFSYGVKSYDMLYYLIDMMENDLPIEATRKPHLVKSSNNKVSVLDFAKTYIRESPTPVSNLELKEEFKVKRGINTASLCTSILTASEDIVLVGDEVYWSTEKLNITDDFLERFDRTIGSSIRYADKIADLFYAKSDVIRTFSSLPSLTSMRWNDYVLKAVFRLSKTFNSFGVANNCIVNLSEDEIFTPEEFYRALLEREFLGWAPFDTFKGFCSQYRINMDLVPEFFDSFDSISADSVEISLK